MTSRSLTLWLLLPFLLGLSPFVLVAALAAMMQ
jgi:hypothetical protein